MEQNSQHASCPHRSSGSAKASISDRINAATQKQHTALNKLIIARLPLALPPSVSNPAVLGQGLAAFASIYFTFEKVWDDIIEPACDRDQGHLSHEATVRRWLASSRPAGLPRTKRLRDDLQCISLRTGLCSSERSGAQARLLEKIQRSLQERPHTLVAYAWVMYMALFSGGRWIRQAFRRAGPQFWDPSNISRSTDEHCPEKQITAETPGFSFLYFDDGKDGLDIKAEFKSRLAAAESILSEQEKQDIVVAATSLFDDCIILVRMLDREVGSQALRSRLPPPLRTAAALSAVILLILTGMKYWTM